MRERLPDRRYSVTVAVPYIRIDGDDKLKLIVTVGFDGQGNAKEVFCASLQVGSDLNAIVTDACILVSRLLQHGDDPDALLASMAPEKIGRSLVATLVATVITTRDAVRQEYADEAPADTP